MCVCVCVCVSSASQCGYVCALHHIARLMCVCGSLCVCEMPGEFLPAGLCKRVQIHRRRRAREKNCQFHWCVCHLFNTCSSTSPDGTTARSTAYPPPPREVPRRPRTSTKKYKGFGTDWSQRSENASRLRVVHAPSTPPYLLTSTPWGINVTKTREIDTGPFE